MPHIIVKMYPGRPESTKKDLTQEIIKSVVKITECDESAVSVAIEEIEADKWAQDVYRPDILDCPGQLYQEPGYNPFETKETKQENSSDLMEYVRNAALLAQQEDASDYFSPMSWMDLQLEDNPEIFDPYFDTPWHELSDDEKGERAMAIRRVL